MFFADSVFIADDQGNLASLTAPIEQAASLPPSDMGMALVKMLLTLIALIGLLLATYWFLKRLIYNRLQKGSGKQSIAILEKRMISTKTMLYLIQVQDRQILFAESHLEVKMLDHFPVEPPQGQNH